MYLKRYPISVWRVHTARPAVLDDAGVEVESAREELWRACCVSLDVWCDATSKDVARQTVEDGVAANLAAQE
jgi:hypothetical protein